MDRPASHAPEVPLLGEHVEVAADRHLRDPEGGAQVRHGRELLVADDLEDAGPTDGQGQYRRVGRRGGLDRRTPIGPGALALLDLVVHPALPFVGSRPVDLSQPGGFLLDKPL